MTKLEEAAQNLRKHLGYDHYTYTIGIAAKSEFNPEDRLIVYLHKKVRTAFPTTFEGFPVETKYVGKIEIKRSKDGGI
jgi:hypothetical protein